MIADGVAKADRSAWCKGDLGRLSVHSDVGNLCFASVWAHPGGVLFRYDPRRRPARLGSMPVSAALPSVIKQKYFGRLSARELLLDRLSVLLYTYSICYKITF